MESVLIHNQLPTGFGDGYSRVFSIPQGCPFSMTFIALLLRPWILDMRKCHVKPRLLADDLSVTASGSHASDHIQQFLRADNPDSWIE